MCASKFDAEEEEVTIAEEYLTWNEIEAGTEEKHSTNDEALDPISDNAEEDEDVIHIAPHLQPTALIPSYVALGKRPIDITSEAESEAENKDLDSIDVDDGDELPIQDTQLRTSGRVRKWMFKVNTSRWLH